MPKLRQSVKALRQQFSLQLNRGRELLARPVSRPQDYTRLVEDAERWDRENALLLNAMYADASPDYTHLTTLLPQESFERALHDLRSELAATLRRLEEIEAGLTGQPSGCLGR
jgi:hypothetical protein